MGQKTHPIGFRLGYIKTWESKWYTDKKSYSRYLHEDYRIREYIKKKLYHAGIAAIVIERSTNKCRINIYTAKPAIVIGKRGQEVDVLRYELQRFTDSDVFINIMEVRPAESNAQLISENVGLQIERRVAFRRAMKKAIGLAMKFGAQGVKIQCSGRLGGAEIARTEWYREARVPLHTLRADIEYGYTQARTTYGSIGVKVWVFKEEIWKGGQAPPIKL
ncbi:MAG: 30S ribosomal protein S3 [bacterium]